MASVTETKKPASRDKEQPSESKTERAPAVASPVSDGNRPQAPQIKVDDSHASAMYANFCRATGTPEELILDFGLNPQPFGTPTEPIAVSQRIIVNYFTAKRMLGALQVSIARHEAAFGVLETDVQKRVQPRMARPASS